MLNSYGMTHRHVNNCTTLCTWGTKSVRSGGSRILERGVTVAQSVERDKDSEFY